MTSYYDRPMHRPDMSMKLVGVKVTYWDVVLCTLRK